MKKILLSICLLVVAAVGFGQHPIGTDSLALQTLGNSNTLVKSKGAIGADSGLINASYADTTAANRGKIKNYPGALIRVSDTIWMRSANATKWVAIGGAGITLPILAKIAFNYGFIVVSQNPYDPYGEDIAVYFDSAAIRQYVDSVISHDTTISQSVSGFDFIADTASNDPPTVSDGYVVLIGASPTGAFAGHAQQIATKVGGVWSFNDSIQAFQSLEVRNQTQLHFYKYTGAVWNRISVADLIGGITGIYQPDIGTIDSNSFTIKTHNINAIIIDALQKIFFPKFIGADTSTAFFKPIDPLTGELGIGHFKPLKAGTNITLDVYPDSTVINSTGGGGGTYTAGHGLVLQGNQFKIQDTLDGAGTKLMYLFNKSAFRVGATSGTQWDYDSIGTYSFAAGLDNKVRGQWGAALGGLNYITSNGTSSFTTGFGNYVSNSNAVALGASDSALQSNSIVLGSRLIGNQTSEVVVGRFNDTTGTAAAGNGAFTYPNDSSVTTLKRAFEVGIGGGTVAFRRNAFQVLYSGRIMFPMYNQSRFYVNDTSSNKPLVISSTGNISSSSWFGSGGGGSGGGLNIYNADSTLAGNRTVTGSNRSITWDGVSKFSINANDSFHIAINSIKTATWKSTGLHIYQIAAGTAGTDSLLTISNGQVKKIAPTYYALGSQVDTTTLLGAIYSKNNWSSLSDFTQNGGAATWGTSSGRITVSGGTNVYTQSLDYNYYTALNFWNAALKFGINAAPGATSGMALGIRSANSTNPLGLALRIDLSNTGTAGLIALVNITGSTPTNLAVSTSALSFSNGDSILLYIERSGNVITGYARNVTTNSSPVRVLYAFSAAYGTTLYLPNTGKFAAFPFTGNYIIDSFDVRSKEVKYANWGMMGTSKTTGYFAGAFPSGFAQLTGANLKNFVINAGAGDLATQGLARVPEITALGIQNVILEYGANDVADTTTFKTNYAALVSGLQAAGITVWHLSPIFETAFDQTAIYNWMRTTYPTNFIDVWNIGRLTGALVADGIHTTTYADSIIYNKIIYTILPKKVNTVNYVAGSGVTPNLTYFTGANSVANVVGVNADATNGRLGFGTGTTSPSHTITLDSLNSLSGIALYKSQDQTTNYARLRIFQNAAAYNISAEKAGTGSLLSILFNGGNTRVISDGTFQQTSTSFLTTVQTSNITVASASQINCNNFFANGLRSVNHYEAASSASSGFGAGFFQHPTVNESGTASTSVLTIAPYFQSTGSGAYYVARFTKASNATGNFNANDFLTVFPSGNVNIGDSVDRSSTFYVNGSLALKYVAKAVDYTATSTDQTIEVTATGKTITLPTAVGITGRIYTIKLTASGSGTVATTSSQTIDGSTTYSLSAQYKYVTVMSNGANWIITANN